MRMEPRSSRAGRAALRVLACDRFKRRVREPVNRSDGLPESADRSWQMRGRIAFVDERALARGFKTGDVVQRTGLRDLFLAPYYGRVLYSNVECGYVTVQWPWGAEQESPAELVIVKSEDVVPVLDVDQVYSSWDAAIHGLYGDDPDPGHRGLSARVACAYEHRTLPLWRAACRQIHHGASEIEAYRNLMSKFSDEFGSDAVRVTVANLFELGRRMGIYWKNNKRQYKITKKERESGKIICPSCKGIMKHRTYRQGQKVLQCRTCGFSIHPADLIV